tara:strand:- start:4746 stop:5009 length:264 start_codon:yes stop_codon:yes gene_type:complete
MIKSKNQYSSYQITSENSAHLCLDDFKASTILDTKNTKTNLNILDGNNTFALKYANSVKLYKIQTKKIPRTYVRGIDFWWSLAGSNR